MSSIHKQIRNLAASGVKEMFLFHSPSSSEYAAMLQYDKELPPYDKYCKNIRLMQTACDEFNIQLHCVSTKTIEFIEWLEHTPFETSNHSRSLYAEQRGILAHQDFLQSWIATQENIYSQPLEVQIDLIVKHHVNFFTWIKRHLQKNKQTFLTYIENNPEKITPPIQDALEYASCLPVVPTQGTLHLLTLHFKDYTPDAAVSPKSIEDIISNYVSVKLGTGYTPHLDNILTIFDIYNHRRDLDLLEYVDPEKLKASDASLQEVDRNFILETTQEFKSVLLILQQHQEQIEEQLSTLFNATVTFELKHHFFFSTQYAIWASIMVQLEQSVDGLTTELYLTEESIALYADEFLQLQITMPQSSLTQTRFNAFILPLAQKYNLKIKTNAP